MSSPYNESAIKLNLVKQKIISSLLLSNYDLISMVFARIYTANAHNNSSWLYTELEGALCLVIDYARKSARFLMFDLVSLEITFESEFYKNFNVFYSCLSETFQCFEVNGGFIGFNIPDKISAKNLLKSVVALSDQVISKKIKENKIINKNDIKSTAVRSLQMLKKKLSEEYFFKESLISQNKIEFDAYQIEKLFSVIEYDPNTQSFLVTGNSEEVEELLGKVSAMKVSDKGGLKISDRKAYAMEIYRNLVASDKNKQEIKKGSEFTVERVKFSAIEETSGKKEIKKEKTKEIKEMKINKETQPAKNVPVVPSKPVPPVPKGVPAVPAVPKVPVAPQKGVPTPPPKGVPPVPKGVPPVPKGVPAVPKAPVAKPQVPNQTVNKNLTNNTQTTQSSSNEINVPTGGDQPVTVIQEKQPPKKREPAKPDMMSELKMRFANRANQVTGGTNTGETNSASNLSNNQSTVNTSQAPENKRKK
jgi:hypothetical protein